ncbi:hypothetical protein TCAL_05752 [Tigriopus californicus]|uniref:D-aminoacyl-tRNA deacylase n=1 Tax=Tigriopus californicus TaxID=6832 RepID=A0A553NAY2_TIGCA|nr:D-aminoacyl-tRNA deacylase-like [Tigriopus californicus]TRY62601.1 hypothetical protein TCAL_05752 [Tigriopus californicus]|eukprot:TCALIF_05752-PA protein Name:"Similar to DTD1 D-tyrosyl-tRNA(Tyr) deacylase 1 (Bos taurus)" AED:0.02 eAED:0.02 QI:0/-1/0/1/-1/1/1/0/169
MKAIIQRVSKASVSVNGELISEIAQGLCVLIGIHKDDTPKQREFLVRKILNLRIFVNPSNGKRWDKSAKDLNLEILCISQFTLYHVIKGNKLDFHLAMSGEQSKEFYHQFLSEIRSQYQSDKVKDGRFGALMEVNITNDGPVTLEIESLADSVSKLQVPNEQEMVESPE